MLSPARSNGRESEFCRSTFTRKIEILEGDALVAEIKGAIREVEVGPGKVVDWYLVPVQTVDEGEMSCELPGHRESGMFVPITVK